MPNSYTQLAADNFTRANENPLSGGGKWSAITITGFGAVQLLSNQVVPTVVNLQDNSAYTGIAWPNDQYAEIVVAADATGCTIGACCRMSTGNMYYTQVVGPLGVGTATQYISKYVANAGTNIVNIPVTLAVGSVVRLEVQGTTLTAKINGVTMLTTTDASLASGSAGLFAYGTPGVANAAIAYWDAGSITNIPGGGDLGPGYDLKFRM